MLFAQLPSQPAGADERLCRVWSPLHDDQSAFRPSRLARRVVLLVHVVRNRHLQRATARTVRPVPCARRVRRVALHALVAERAPVMTKHERAHILGTRALQISRNAPVMVELEGETDPVQIAMKELKQRGGISINTRRYLPDKSYEDWPVTELTTLLMCWPSVE